MEGKGPGKGLAQVEEQEEEEEVDGIGDYSVAVIVKGASSRVTSR